MIVLDASAAIEFLLGTEIGARVDAQIGAMGGAHLHAPHLIDLEVVQVLRRFVSVGTISAARGEQAIQDLLGLPLTRYRHDVLLPRIWELRSTLTAYDASYVALAEVLGAPLVTCDQKIAGAPGHAAIVYVV